MEEGTDGGKRKMQDCFWNGPNIQVKSESTNNASEFFDKAKIIKF